MWVESDGEHALITGDFMHLRSSSPSPTSRRSPTPTPTSLARPGPRMLAQDGEHRRARARHTLPDAPARSDASSPTATSGGSSPSWRASATSDLSRRERRSIGHSGRSSVPEVAVTVSSIVCISTTSSQRPNLRPTSRSEPTSSKPHAAVQRDRRLVAADDARDHRVEAVVGGRASEVARAAARRCPRPGASRRT